MRDPKKLFGALVLLLAGSAVRADVMVLVHGYLGSAASWETSGVSSALQAKGWPRAGVLLPGPGGIHLRAAAGRNAANKTYAVQLPSTAPLMIQARLLAAMLGSVRAMHPEESMVLVGHSAGGVVARLALVQGQAPEASHLITIASPHLGTSRAAQALEFTNDSAPVGWVKRLFVGKVYDEVRHSRGLLLDLLPARPGSTLGMLNAARHPDVRYVSILRGGPVGMGDELVPVVSQDMHHVPALRGRGVAILATGEHALQASDGQVLIDSLASKSRPEPSGGGR